MFRSRSTATSVGPLRVAEVAGPPSPFCGKPVEPLPAINVTVPSMARFLMNVMLASGGYPWTVIRVEDCNSYLDALDRASIDTDIRPFAEFIAQRVV